MTKEFWLNGLLALMIALVAGAVVFASESLIPANKDASGVAWVGAFPHGSTFNGEIDGSVAVLTEIEIGLRPDGVVVWRKRPEVK